MKKQGKNRFINGSATKRLEGRKDRLRFSGFGSIRSRLTWIGLIFILGTSLAMAVAGVRLTTGFMEDRARHNFQLLASSLARNAELGILLENPQMLETLARNMLVLEDVEEVVISGTKRDLLHRQKEGRIGKGLSQVSAPVFAERLDPEIAPGEEQERHQIGTVSIRYSRAGLDLPAREMAGHFLLFVLVLAAAPVLLYGFMARAIVGPLKSLLAVTREVSRGRLDIRADGGSLPETRALAATFNEMLDALTEQRRRLAEAHSRMARQEALAELGKFSMMVAHEIKNPLAIIKGSLDLLKKEELDPETKITVGGYLDEEVDRINRLIEDFLLFSRPSPPAFREVAVADFLISLIDRMELAQRDGEVTIELEPVDPNLTLFCDPNLLERALANILRNAFEAGATRIGLHTGLEDGRLLLRISDNGPGIGEEVAPRLFEPFFSTKAKGSGLGLAMVKEIIETHGGRIGLAPPSTAGGTVFCLEIPLRGEELEKVDGTHSDS